MHFEVDSLSFRGMILCLTRSLFEAVGTIPSQYLLDLSQCLLDPLQQKLAQNNLLEYQIH